MHSLLISARSIPIWMWVLILVVCVNLVQAFMPWIEPNPIYYTNLPFPTESPVRLGEPVTIHVVRCTDRHIHEPIDFTYARVLHNVEGGRDYALSDGIGVSLPGCVDTANSTLVLPLNITPGKYQLIGVVRSQGAFAAHKIVYQSQIFDIVP